ncbi:unnamed protein product [Protopolystoma xenopodis]|uniref:Uncharacterized protein n=1 Tax=Protopolystoma xenopodis TaxID=117903 RepID=A0A3S5AZG1_9PLAT|nr:unnamed protein product [Protopolystoma xenopodis]
MLGMCYWSYGSLIISLSGVDYSYFREHFHDLFGLLIGTQSECANRLVFYHAPRRNYLRRLAWIQEL